MTCGPAKTPKTRRPSRSPRRSPQPATSPPPRSATPVPPSPTPAPWGSATSTCGGRGRWPPAPPTTFTDTATTRELLALLDGYQPGQLAAMQRAERDLARARLRRRRWRPGRRRGVRRRDHRAAPALHPLPPGPRPARPRRPPRRPRRHRRPPRLLSAKPAASPSGCAARRWSTARTPSSPPGPAPRPRDDRIRQPRASPPPPTRPLSPTASTPWECHAAQPLRSYPGAPTPFEPHSTATTADPGDLLISYTARCHRFRCQHFHSCACGLRHARWPSATVAIRQKSPQAHPADDARAVRAGRTSLFTGRRRGRRPPRWRL